MQLNTQPPEIINSAEESIEVFDHFKTIQGEGPYVGCQAIFLRLAGCNLQCPLCDTDYTSKRETVKINDFRDWAVGQKQKLIVITGGEPMRQKALARLCQLLIFAGKTVQIETNGSYYQALPPEVTVVCSPKTPSISWQLEPLIDCWKYVMRHDAVDPSDGLPSSALGMKRPPARPSNHTQIYLQPCDDQDDEINNLNLQAVLKSCEDYQYRLCLQIQKIINLP